MTDPRPQPGPPLLEIDGLKAWYHPGQPVLDLERLSIRPHTVPGLLGLNGAGKTTLINTLVGVHEKAQVGSVTWNGASAALRSPTFQRARYAVFTEHAGFMFWALDPYLRFLERVYRRTVDAARVDALVAGFQFGGFRTRPIGSLSTGNKKKVFLIAGLALGLPLLILDEPVDGLDFESTEFLYTALVAYKEVGAVFMSSHIAESFTRSCDALYLLRAGDLTGPHPITPDTDVRALVREDADS